MPSTFRNGTDLGDSLSGMQIKELIVLEIREESKYVFLIVLQVTLPEKISTSTDKLFPWWHPSLA